jgi:hypothetical protein
VTDVVKEGDKVKVKFLGADERGKVRLSMKVVDQETARTSPSSSRPSASRSAPASARPPPGSKPSPQARTGCDPAHTPKSAVRKGRAFCLAMHLA